MPQASVQEPCNGKASIVRLAINPDCTN